MSRLRSVLLFAAPALFAQEFRATLSGRITDSSGAAVAGASVEAIAAATGAVATGTSAEDGNYSIPFLQPGTYKITVQKAGFQKAIRDGLRLQIAERASLDLSLQVGEVNQSVNVTEGCQRGADRRRRPRPLDREQSRAELTAPRA
jgi:hypothetical protein